MNRKRDIEDIRDLYLEKLTSNKVKTNTDDTAFAPGKKAELAKTGGEEKSKADTSKPSSPPRGSGSASKDNTVPMKDDNAFHGDMDIAKNTGPEAADNFQGQIVDKEDEHYNAQQLSDPSRKTQRESINTFDMSKNSKSDFDRLYEFAMEGDDDLEAMGGDDLGAMLGDDEPEMGEEEGGDDLKGQLMELRDKIDSIIDSLDGGDEEEDLGDEIEGEDDLGLDDVEGENVTIHGTMSKENKAVRQERVVSEPEPKVLGGHGDRQHPDQGKGPWSKRASGTYSGHGGNAEHGDIDEAPEPKPLGGHGDRSHPEAGKLPGLKVKTTKKKNKPGDHALGS